MVGRSIYANDGVSQAKRLARIEPFMERAQTVVAVIMIDGAGRVLVQHRDNKAEIPYPRLLDCAGGSG